MPSLSRPQPPDALLSDPVPAFVPAADLAAWLSSAFIEPGGPLHAPRHEPLARALIGCIWTNVDFIKGGSRVAGQAERPKSDGSAWIKGRHEHQLVQWFGDVPDFLLTFHAPTAAALSDRAWCALADHELRHCGQARDRFGAPRFDRDGRPIYTLVGHDVEEFVDIAARYGGDVCAGRTVDFAAAAAGAPLIGDDAIAAACGRPPPPGPARRRPREA